MTAKTRQYVIYRSGSNAANQSMTNEAIPVFLVESVSVAAAIKSAMDAGVTCYANQHMTAKPSSRVSRRDWDSAWSATEGLNVEIANLLGGTK